MTDLRQHDASDNVIVLMFSEFGRRVRDNGSGTDQAPRVRRSCSATR